MSYIDPNILSKLGIELVRGDVPIPLYTRKVLTPFPEQGTSRAVTTSLSQQVLASLILQITDPLRFIRYVI
jgi:hypothetical protein